MSIWPRVCAFVLLVFAGIFYVIFGCDSHEAEAMLSPRYGTKRKKKFSSKKAKKQGKRDTGRV